MCMRTKKAAKAAAGSTEPAEVRTNIVMEEPLVREAQAITGIKTKTGVVHYALREIVRRAKQKEMLALRGKVAWEGDLDEMRKSRY
jgi:Arc/MetJ family transcription regulator